MIDLLHVRNSKPFSLSILMVDNQVQEYEISDDEN